jgi:hypothetical protein
MMNCPNCEGVLIAGTVRVQKSPWRFAFNWMQSHLRGVFQLPSGRVIVVLKYPNERSAYFCPRCRAVVVAPRVGSRVARDRTPTSYK